jgi:hypothetical protein
LSRVSQARLFFPGGYWVSGSNPYLAYVRINQLIMVARVGKCKIWV